MPMHITYNPGILGEEELARSFVVRQQSLEMILETLRENAASPANRHILLIGPRGIGKTMLVRRAALAVWHDPELRDNWYPLVFGEESYPVTTPGEFWLEAIFHLADQTGEGRYRKALEELRGERNDARLREQALAQLLDFADSQKKRILLVVENLNMLVGEQMDQDAAWELRHTLLNEFRLMLLGTATNRFDQIENAGHAWFEMFSVQKLETLNLDECGVLWQSVTGSPLDRNPLKAIRILTGGNPRLVTILASFAAKRSFRQLMEQLVHLIDDHTEYFRGHLENLATQERRVFVALLERWDPGGAAEIAEQTRLGVNEVSTLLGRLCDRGAVEVLQQEGRKRLYQAAERLYNIYYLMRRRGHSEGRVQAAVQFMVTFYERDELVTRLADLAREACALPEEARKDHYSAYNEVLRKVRQIAARVVQSTPPEFFKATAGKLARDLGVSGLIAEAHSLYHAANLHDSEKFYRLALELDEGSADAWAGLGWVLAQDSARIVEAEKAARRAIAIDPSDVHWHCLGLILTTQERWLDAEEALSKAVELDSREAEFWSNLANARFELHKFSGAEQANRMAIQLAPNEAVHWNNLAGCLWHLGQVVKAEEAYRKCIELGWDGTEPWKGLGHLLLETGPPEEAERIWTEALSRYPDQLTNCSVHLLELQLARGVERSTILHEAGAWVARSHHKPKTLEVMAKFVARSRLTKGLALAETWAQEAYAKHPDWETASALALVQAEMNRWGESIESCGSILDSAANNERARDFSTEFLIRAAAVGSAKDALAAIKKSKGATALEPLVVGIEIYLGEAPVVAKEIFEIGQDVAERIRAAASAQTGPEPAASADSNAATAASDQGPSPVSAGRPKVARHGRKASVASRAQVPGKKKK